MPSCEAHGRMREEMRHRVGNVNLAVSLIRAELVMNNEVCS